MRLLLRSDSQAEISNLDLCRISLLETFKWAKEYKVDAVIDAGDLKEAYSPVHVAVVKFWVWAVREFKRRGIRFIALLGNHDRISQSSESKNWLDILQAAGAEIVTKPKFKSVGDGWVGFLPFTADKKLEKAWAGQLSDDCAHNRAVYPEAKRVLVFHTEISGGFLNSSNIPTSGLTPEQLGWENYDGCFGGHIHRAQHIKETNIHYIGSPFTHDWSEVNQRKSQVLFTEKGMRRLKTSIPCWYDAEHLEARGLIPPPGAYVRSRVPVTSKKITQQLKDEEERILKTFSESKDLRLFIIPKLEDSKDTVSLKGSSDKELVEQYVTSTWPDGSRNVAEQGVAYLLGVLERVAPAARGKALRFVSLEGENVLSFKHIRIKYSKQGFIVLRGVNLDWPKRSIGSGKTNCLSLLSIALTGETIKGQKANGWKNERVKGQASLKLTLRDERNRKIVIYRTRPHSLRLLIDGKDQSAGIRGTGKKETQGLIQQITGYDKNLLENAVYIDQSIANSFVFGSKSARLDLLNKIQNLERYDQALKIVSKDIDRNQKSRASFESSVELLSSELVHVEDELSELAPIQTDWEKRRVEAQKEVTKLIGLKTQYAQGESQAKELQRVIDDLEAELNEIKRKQNEARLRKSGYEDQLSRAKKLVANGRCANCGQPAENRGLKMREEAEAEIRNLTQRLVELGTSIETKGKAIARHERTLDEYTQAKSRVDVDLAAARKVLQQADIGAAQEEKRNDAVKAKKLALIGQIKKIKRTLKAAQESLRHADEHRELLEYAKKAFHRSGMPLYLSASLCPVLNKAADEYSELFADGSFTCRFDVEDGDFVVRVVNPTGSNTVDGQSTGERATAGNIAAFAVREVAPKTNLIILDEPGHGLDTESAKQFAKGLLRLKEKFETVLLTTHSSTIESILAGSTTWTVTKKKGISRLETE